MNYSHFELEKVLIEIDEIILLFEKMSPYSF